MVSKLDRLEKQFGGEIPFSALESKKIKKKNKSKKISKTSKMKVKSKKIHRRKKSVSPSRFHRKNTRKLKRSKKQTKIIKLKNCQCGSHTYNGSEFTPRGLGNCEECMPLNSVMKGKDKKLYENTVSGWSKLN